MKQVFVSYHFTARSGKVNGFGNWIGEGDEELYRNDLKQFILESEKTISELLTGQLGFDVAVRVLNFR